MATQAKRVRRPPRSSIGPAPASSIVEAKLTLPFLRPGIVERRALVERLHASRGVPVVALVAPPGYGKTTVLTQWAERDERPVAWLTLDEQDTDPSVFLTYVAVALDRILPLDQRALEALVALGPIDVAVRLGAAIRALDEPFLLILDDVHRLHGVAATDALAVLIAHLPSGSQAALAGRMLPELPIARLRAEGRVLEVDGTDLALSDDEAGRLFRQCGAEIDDAEVHELAGRAEGWAAALYLAALSARSGRPTAGPISFAGDDLYVAEYLRTELLAGLPLRDVRFMTRTSVLERMTGPLCGAVTGGRGSAATLERLERSNLLLVPLDRRGEWFRYHHLLRDFLERELERQEPGLASELRRRAAVWHQANGRPEDAVEYALASGDADLASELLLPLVLPLYRFGHAVTLDRWFRWFEERGLEGAYPSIAGVRVLLLSLSGDPVGAERWLSIAERASASGAARTTATPPLSLIRAIRGVEGLTALRADADRALELVPPDDPWYAPTVFAKAVAQWLADDPGALARLEEAVEVAIGLGAAPAASVAIATLGISAASRGAWTEAGERVEQARSLIRQANLTWYSTSFLVFALGARVAAHAGDGEGARADIVRTQRLRPVVGRALPWLAVEGRIQLIHAHVAMLDASDVRTLVREIHEIRRHCGDLGKLDEEVEELEALVASVPGLAMGSSALTTAELRVLPYLQTHLSFREIGGRLFISSNTVKTHALSIYRKLGASSRSDAVLRAREIGLLEG